MTSEKFNLRAGTQLKVLKVLRDNEKYMSATDIRKYINTKPHNNYPINISLVFLHHYNYIDRIEGRSSRNQRIYKYKYKDGAIEHYIENEI